MSSVFRIATRESELALRRARGVQAMLAERNIDSELVTFKTTGDKRFAKSVSLADAKTAFSHELEAALRKRKADIAVHALPDLPVDLSPGLIVSAIPPREDPRDVLVVNELIEATALQDLPRGSRVGTSSIRCRAMLSALYPQLEIAHLRGDLRTRLKKVDEGQVHATIVSAAAMHRLDVSQRIAAYLEPPEWLPAPGQGGLALQVREDDRDAMAAVSPLDDPRSRADTAAERACLAALEGGPQSPVGALVLEAGGHRAVHAAIASPLGPPIVRAQVPMDDDAPELAGVRLANELRAKGASRILDALRGVDRVGSPQPD